MQICKKNKNSSPALMLKTVQHPLKCTWTGKQVKPLVSGHVYYFNQHAQQSYFVVKWMVCVTSVALSISCLMDYHLDI